mmetsp:Transcript_7079/g.10422  ORF Transcript_7079/g.10422 Transcript_7079/m.10422 type:complete len:1709 (+) Transcript_7079:683-5809(+)
MPEHLKIKPTLPDDAPEVPPHPEPLIYVLLPDYPQTLEEIRSFQEANLNYNAVLEIQQKSIAGPPKKPTPVQTEEEDPKKKKKPDKKAAKKPPPKKGKQPESEDKNDFINDIREHIEKVQQENRACTIRNVVVMQQTYYRYTYTEEYAELNDGNDDEYEIKRFVENLEKHITSIALAHRDYYNERGIKRLHAIPQHVEVPAANMTYYNELLHEIPDEACSIPVVMHCMVEQVVRNLDEQEHPKEALTDEEKERDYAKSIEDSLDAIFADTLMSEQSENNGEEEKEIPQTQTIEYGNDIAQANVNNYTIQGKTVESIELEKLKLLNMLPFDANTIPQDLAAKEDLGARLTELYHFVQSEEQLSPEQIQHQLKLSHFANMLNVPVHERNVIEQYELERFLQVLRRHCLMFLPELKSKFYELDASLLIAYAMNVPAERFTRKQWEQRFSVVPYFGEWFAALESLWEISLAKAHEDEVKSHHAAIEQRKRDEEEAERLAKEREELARLRKKKRGKKGKEEVVEEEQEEVVVEEEEEKEEDNLPPPPTEEELEMKRISSIRVADETIELEQFKGEGFQRYVFEGKGANLLRDETIFYPSDGAFIRLLSDRSVKTNNGCSVFKDGVNFGVRTTEQGIVYTSVYEDNTVTVVQADENDNTQLSVGACNGLYYHQDVKSGEIYQAYPSHLTPKSSRFGAGFNYLKQNIPECMTVNLNEKSTTLSIYVDGAIQSILATEVNRRFIPGVDAKGGACILKNYDNGCVQLIYANGETSTSSPDQQTWLQVNEHGERFVKTRGQDDITNLETIQVATSVESQLDATIVSREDFVTKVIYKDGTVLVQHTDGTRFWQYNRDTVNDDTVDSRISPELNTIMAQHALFGEIIVGRDTCDISIRLPGLIISTLNLINKQFTILKDGHQATVNVNENTISFVPASQAFLEKHNKVQLKNNQGVYLMNYVTGGLKTFDVDGHEFTIDTKTAQSFISYRTPILGKNKRDLQDFSIPSCTIIESGEEIVDEEENVDQEVEDNHKEEEEEEPADKEVNEEKVNEEDANEEEIKEEVKEVVKEEIPTSKVRIYGRIPTDDKHLHIQEPRLFAFQIENHTITEYTSDSSLYPFIESAKRDDYSTYTEDKNGYKTGIHIVVQHVPPIDTITKTLPKTLVPFKLGGTLSSTQSSPTLYTKRSLLQYQALSEEQKDIVAQGVSKWEQWDDNRRAHEKEMQSHLETPGEAQEDEEVYGEQEAAVEQEEAVQQEEEQEGEKEQEGENEEEEEKEGEIVDDQQSIHSDHESIKSESAHSDASKKSSSSAPSEKDEEEEGFKIKESDVDQAVENQVQDIYSKLNNQSMQSADLIDDVDSDGEEDFSMESNQEHQLAETNRPARPQSATYKSILHAANQQTQHDLLGDASSRTKTRQYAFWDHATGRDALQNILSSKSDEEKALDAMMNATTTSLSHDDDSEDDVEEETKEKVAAERAALPNESADTLVLPPSEPEEDETPTFIMAEDSLIQPEGSESSSRHILSRGSSRPHHRKPRTKQTLKKKGAPREPILNVTHRNKLNKLRKQVQSSEELAVLEKKLGLSKSNFVVFPESVEFGCLKPGNKYKGKALLTNSGHATGRFTVKVLPPSKNEEASPDNNLHVEVTRGPVPPGISRQMTLVYRPTKEGTFVDMVRVKTPDHEIFLSVRTTVSSSDELPANRIQRIQFNRSLLRTIKEDNN